MSRRKNLSPEAVARERLVREARQRKAREHAQAVAAGVAETVALSRARGAAIAEPTVTRKRVRLQPYRRQTGLEWLEAKGRIGAPARAAGEHYGWAYRRVKLEKAIPSTLGQEVRGAFMAPSLAEVIARGEGTEIARMKLAELRARLKRQPDLIAACDLICGEEKTPREAAGGVDRDAAKLEGLLKVALDFLV
ncbi:MAG: hypothetical protein JNL41_22445 [Phenylobacterium sp.]|uniref:hypothetical protein n=1 Tax=Phenylobacterium sp. TaxID=1871053 RepID=UPI001A50D30D|nr:hypothetical protein [Phenylobacterium sp.]MBL8557050.1 hypothetical protein [Phenylobacterium sp.]